MTFYQQGQKVHTQHNAGRDINFAGQGKSEDLVDLLDVLKRQLAQAHIQGLLDEDTSTDAQYHVTKALQQARKPQPDKKSILDYLASAQKLVEGVASAGGLVTSIIHIVEMVQKVF